MASSIKEHGIIQPIVVREYQGSYQLIAGERRWQAARKAGLSVVPCRVVDVIDQTACEFAIEENLKRKDLNDLEKAQAFRDYLDQFRCTIEELGKQVSMSRSAISNILRLLELTDPVKNALHSGRISAGHARALLPLEGADQLALCGRIQSEKLTVRDTESAVKELQRRKSEEASGPGTDPAEAQQTLPIQDGSPERTAHVDSLEDQLRDLLGVKVEIKLKGKDQGVVMIPFASNAEFERILKTVRRSAA